MSWQLNISPFTWTCWKTLVYAIFAFWSVVSARVSSNVETTQRIRIWNHSYWHAVFDIIKIESLTFEIKRGTWKFTVNDAVHRPVLLLLLVTRYTLVYQNINNFIKFKRSTPKNSTLVTKKNQTNILKPLTTKCILKVWKQIKIHFHRSVPVFQLL